LRIERFARFDQEQFGLTLLLRAAIEVERLGQLLDRFGSIGFALEHGVLHVEVRIASCCPRNLLHRPG